MSRFAQYLKDTHGPLDELQFLIAANDIQHRVHCIINNTDNDDNSNGHLQWQLWELYKNYVHETAPDRLYLSDDLVDELRSIVENQNIHPETIENIIEKVINQLLFI